MRWRICTRFRVFLFPTLKYEIAVLRAVQRFRTDSSRNTSPAYATARFNIGHTPRKFPAFLQQPLASSHVKLVNYTILSKKNQGFMRNFYQIWKKNIAQIFINKIAFLYALYHIAVKPAVTKIFWNFKLYRVQKRRSVIKYDGSIFSCVQAAFLKARKAIYDSAINPFSIYSKDLDAQFIIQEEQTSWNNN